MNASELSMKVRIITTIKRGWFLFKKTYSARKYSAKDQNFLKILKIRSWLLYLLYNVICAVQKISECGTPDADGE